MPHSSQLNLSLAFWVLMTPGIVLFVLGWLLYRRAKRKRLGFDRYRFEHRTSGGTVVFDTFETSQSFHKKERRTNNIGLLGGFMACVGFAWMLIVFLLVNGNWKPFR